MERGYCYQCGGVHLNPTPREEALFPIEPLEPPAVEPKPEFDINKPFALANGWEVVIYTTKSGDPKYPIHGRIENPALMNGQVLLRWRPNGVNCFSCHSEWNLVNTREKKTIKRWIVVHAGGGTSTFTERPRKYHGLRDVFAIKEIEFTVEEGEGLAQID
jgi:hypothetical protein